MWARCFGLCTTACGKNRYYPRFRNSCISWLRVARVADPHTPTMISNLFRFLFTATLATGAVVAVVGHSIHGLSGPKKIATAHKTVNHPHSMGFENSKR